MKPVYLQVNDNYHYLGECILKKLNCESSNDVNIFYSRSSTVFNVSLSGNHGYKLPIYHSARCPALRLCEELGFTQTLEKKVPVLCGMILKTLDSKVL